MTSLPRETASSSGAGEVSMPDSSNFNSLLKLKPKECVAADSMSESKSKELWNRLYVAAGLGSAGEEKKKSYRFWVYVQGCLNGTSRAGNYDTTGKLADGTLVEAANIPRVLGREIRKFYRANMDESYNFLKGTAVMEEYPRFVAKCSKLGVDASEAFATSDWMDGCPKFTPKESSAHDASFNVGIARARRARGGQNLEGVEHNQLADSVRVNGPDAAEEGTSNMIRDF